MSVPTAILDAEPTPRQRVNLKCRRAEVAMMALPDEV